MLKNVLIAATAVGALTALGSCGTQNVGAGNPDFGNGNAVSSAFKLDVMDETYDFGATAQDLYLAVSAETDTHVVVDVKATGAEGLKGLYFDIAYDPTLYRPMVVEPGEAMGERSDIINIMGIVKPGVMEYGQSLIHQDYQVGFTGSATLAQISFRKENSANRGTSAAASGVKSQIGDLALVGPDTLTWSYQMQGDYDQNGETNAADLSKIAQNFKDVSPGGLNVPWPRTDVKSVIDGDSNGEINGADLTQIAQNFKNSVGTGATGGFHVFHSADIADYPAADPTDPNGAGATELGIVKIDDAVNKANASTERLTFSYTIAAPVLNDVYWLRSYDDTGDEGIASNFTGGNAADLPSLSLAPGTPANSGTGTQADPYNFTTTVDYSFVLLDKPGGADVSADANTVFTVNPGAAGVFTGASLNLDDAFTGDFTVTATYDADGAGGNAPLPNSATSNVYGHVGVIVTPAPVIDKDPADADWATVTGTGADDTNAYILSTPAFNDTFALTFSLQATEGAGGPVITNSDLDWDAFPPFAVADPAAFTADATAGTFQVWEFTSGYVFAQDATTQNSNNLYIAVNSLPN